MPRIFDNIDHFLIEALKETIAASYRADFCVGYFNLRGWKAIGECIKRLKGGSENCVRLLIGMQRLPKDDLAAELALRKHNGEMDHRTAMRLKRKLAQDFREQLTLGAPTNEDESGLKHLAAQIESGKLVVKLFLRHPLHAKLYLCYRQDHASPIVAYLGSSNLTMAGLSGQGELNIDVVDSDAAKKLSKWFEDRWNDCLCIEISKELLKVIDESWASEKLIPPYYIYLKMAYHLSQEARAGLQEFKIPPDFRNVLLDFQVAAVKIAAHRINKRRGVIIGDVVGLGKTLMACAIARIFEDDRDWETLIICPKNLERMWNDYREQYRLRAKVMPISVVQKELPTLRRYRLVIIDESHNLRNREGKRYAAIQEYLKANDCRVVLLSATPYNKTYVDLSNQLRLFIEEDADIGIRPEKLLKQIGETEFLKRYQCPIRSIAAFEKSEFIDDWRDLMRMYLIRRTRSFIMDNYSHTDSSSGKRFLLFPDGKKQYFPDRIPKTVKFPLGSAGDQYAILFSSKVVESISNLHLPRYGLGNYVRADPPNPPSEGEARTLQNLARAGSRLRGFCRASLFKRLESSGFSFIESVKRHILRNFVFIHALENKKDLPIGPQEAEILDQLDDADPELYDEEGDVSVSKPGSARIVTLEDFKKKAAELYEIYGTKEKKRFKWIRSELFTAKLKEDLISDAKNLVRILKKCGEWNPKKDSKIAKLLDLLQSCHPTEKVIVFTQFADTAFYIERELQERGVVKLSAVTGDSSNPTDIAYRFSPSSNNRRNSVTAEEELRVLIATDVLSEGLNLQDCSIVVNYDLPWAIIRLIQRVGRIDRIGQHSDKILCYSFMPAEGVEQILGLRERLRQRLDQNREILGSDELFFEEEKAKSKLIDLYNEKSGVLDDDVDTEVDLASYALQIWKNAVDKNKELEKIIPNLQPVLYSTRGIIPSKEMPEGVLVYVRTAEGNDALAWVDRNGNPVTESQIAILKAAECKEDTPAIPRNEKHHHLVKTSLERIIKEEEQIGGQLGSPRSVAFRVYERLKNFIETSTGHLYGEGNLFYDQLERALEDIYKHPLRPIAIDAINRQLKLRISDKDLADMVLNLRNEGKLCRMDEEEVDEKGHPLIICSMGLFKHDK